MSSEKPDNPCRGVERGAPRAMLAILLAAMTVVPALAASAASGPAVPGGAGPADRLPGSGPADEAAGATGGRAIASPHYFGPYPNFANSPVPKGAVTAITLISGGKDYANPVVTITDMWLTGSGAAATATVQNGTITGITLTAGGSGYSAPVVVITDPAGEYAVAKAELGGPLSGGMRKFVDTLPGLTPAGANNLGNYIPLAAADTTTFPGCDYYEIALVQYTQKMHSDLPETLLRGYVQLETPATASSSRHVELRNPDGSAILKPGGGQAYGVDEPWYLGPTMVAQRDTPVRITFLNLLPTGAGGDLFIPVDTTVMGAGMGALDKIGQPGMKENYTQNRATLHLHGGLVPWISDGTPHQWITPAGENTRYPKGVSVSYVPDMWFENGTVIAGTAGQTAPPQAGATNDPGAGSMTFYYNNQQSARLMFYHDHAYGITRLNVYAGEAAGYVLTDETEAGLLESGVLPNLGGAYAFGIPLVIQDRTFVDAATIGYQDPTWRWGSTPGTPHTGDLWLPHVWMPNNRPDGSENPWGRWNYAPWLEAGIEDVEHAPDPNPHYDPVNAPWEPSINPGVPEVSMAMEAFMDTPVVNGQAYPYLPVEPMAYRFRMLNAGNDRFLNLQLYEADPNVTTADGRTGTEVRMVPAAYYPDYPASWPADGREGGVPDPATAGPAMVQIGTEGGFLPAPVVVPPQPVAYETNEQQSNYEGVKLHSLLLGSAERADVVIDFSKYAGKTLILYNDAPAAFPGGDPRYDYYTGGPDMTATGGAPTTLPGFGPNTRTIMQFRVGNGTPAEPYDLGALRSAFAGTPSAPGVFESGADPILVTQPAYSSAYCETFGEPGTAGYSASSLSFSTLDGDRLTLKLENKALSDLTDEVYDAEYGRMTGLFGLELPEKDLTVIYGYASPPVELIMDSKNVSAPAAGDGTQIWRIRHHGEDTHPFHFHLFNVQVLNRCTFEGLILPTEPNELGWKETVRMNPKEDVVVALRPVAPTQPFELPDSRRLIDPTSPAGAVLRGPSRGFRDPSGDPVVVANHEVNFGWEYVVHCHILGHEEMDMMHGVVFGVAPYAPTNLQAVYTGTGFNLSWTDNSISESAFIVQRSRAGGPWATVATVASPAGSTGPATGGTIRHLDLAETDGTAYSYRVLASKLIGDTQTYSGSAGFPAAMVNSTPSDTVTANATVPGSGVLATIAVSPSPVNVGAGATQAFVATGKDVLGAAITGLAFNWTTDVGRMDGGTLTAQNASGRTGYVRAAIGDISGTASVTVVPGPLARIDVSPANMTLPAGAQLQFSATGRDAHNNTIPGLVFNWTSSVGNISGAGLLTAGPSLGSGTVLASSGGITGSAAVTVTAASANGTVSGIITDSGGRPVAGATVRLIAASGQALTAVTDTAGRFSISAPPGLYNLTVSAGGKRTYTRTGLSVGAGRTTPADARLKSAAATSPAGFQAMAVLAIVVVIVIVAAVAAFLMLRGRGGRASPEPAGGPGK